MRASEIYGPVDTSLIPFVSREQMSAHSKGRENIDWLGILSDGRAIIKKVQASVHYYNLLSTFSQAASSTGIASDIPFSYKLTYIHPPPSGTPMSPPPDPEIEYTFNDPHALQDFITRIARYGISECVHATESFGHIFNRSLLLGIRYRTPNINQVLLKISERPTTNEKLQNLTNLWRQYGWDNRRGPFSWIGDLNCIRGKFLHEDIESAFVQTPALPSILQINSGNLRCNEFKGLSSYYADLFLFETLKLLCDFIQKSVAAFIQYDLII